MAAALTFAALGGLRAATPLSEVVPDAERVSSRLFAAGPCTYLQTTPEIGGGDSLVRAIVWAASREHASLVAERQALPDTVAVDDCDRPPTRLVAGTDAIQYGPLLSSLRDRYGVEKVAEVADYRIMDDGSFICRIIQVPPHEFIFASPDGDDDEVIAIRRRLS